MKGLRCCVCKCEIHIGKVSHRKIYCMKHYKEMKERLSK